MDRQKFEELRREGERLRVASEQREREHSTQPLLDPWEIWAAQLEGRRARFRVLHDLPALPKRVDYGGYEWQVISWTKERDLARAQDASLPRIM